MYQGIDVVYYAAPTGGLEYDAVLAPGASVSDLQMRYEGADSVSVDRHGKLNIDLGFTTVTKSAPVVYQFAADGSREMIESKFSISDGNTVGFEVGDYDQARPLIIDPTLGYSTFLGGSADEVANDVAVDANNNVYITGTTMSTDMPNTAGQTSLGPSDAFLIKLSPTQDGGYTLGYSIIIGGGGEYDQRNGVIGYGEEKSYGVAVDASGSAYITGSTNSFNFPTTDGSSLVDPPPDTLHSPPGTVVTNAFMAKFDSFGDIQYSTVFGRGRAAEGTYPYAGYNIEYQYADLEQVGRGIAVDNRGVAYITGYTFGMSTQIVPVGLTQPLPVDKFHVYDAFVARIRTSVDQSDGPERVIQWNAAEVQGLATNGDGGWDSAYAIAVDSSRNVYITGKTNSPNLGTVAVGGNAAQANLAAPGAYDAFVMKLNGMLTTKSYSTFLGGTGSDEVGYGIAVDSNNSAYVTGVDPAANFPTTPGAYETTKPNFNGSGSTFLTKVNPNGTAWSYSTFVDLPPGASGRAVNAFSITLDPYNNAYLAGQTVAESPARAMVAKINSTGSAVLSNYVWGAPNLSMDFEPLLDTVGKGVAIDSTGKAYVVGYTLENEFQTTTNAYDTTYNGNPYDFYATQDAFFSRITL